MASSGDGPLPAQRNQLADAGVGSVVVDIGTWSSERGLPQFSYTAQEVRTAIAGHPNASRDQLGYAIMLLLGLIGQGRSTHEWEAIAVGHYHLNLVARV